MALIKCHECGAEVSTEAKTCQKCGAKPKKPAGLTTWLIIILIGVGFVAAMSTGGGGASPGDTPTDITPPPAAKPIDPKAQAKAEKITESKFCSALGKALRGRDDEFARAMIKRSADLQLGVPDLDQQDTIKKRQINLGMTQCMALAAWGRPEKVNRSVGSYGTHEQWVYSGNYLYFDDDRLTSWQD